MALLPGELLAVDTRWFFPVVVMSHRSKIVPEYIYLADFNNGEPQLTRVEIINQNSKTYLPLPKSAESILGDTPIVPVVISKAYSGVFDSISRALSYLYGMATAYVQQCQRQTALAKSRAASLEQLIKEVEQANDQPQP